MTRRVTLATLRNAARVAVEAGVWVTIEGPDGTLYKIGPDAQPSPLGASAREQDECDKLFGVSE